MASTQHPRFKKYGVYDAHTDELVSKHDTRAEANAAKGLTHRFRVRGVPGTEYKTKAAGIAAAIARLFGHRS